jgi:hypothetical protein
LDLNQGQLLSRGISKVILKSSTGVASYFLWRRQIAAPFYSLLILNRMLNIDHQPAQRSIIMFVDNEFGLIKNVPERYVLADIYHDTLLETRPYDDLDGVSTFLVSLAYNNWSIPMFTVEIAYFIKREFPENQINWENTWYYLYRLSGKELEKH